jgi:hypothetical protein
MIINCLSVKNPWAYAILNLDKNIENRTRSTAYRGRLYIHSSIMPDPNGITRVLQIGSSLGRIYNDLTIEEMMANNGYILGYADLYDCKNIKSIEPSSNPWGEPNCVHWLLRNPVRLVKPIPAKGQLGVWKWEVPERWEEIIL